MGVDVSANSMDWISITTGCFALSNATAKTSAAIHRFIREVRESRSALDAISSELHSLDGVLDLLKDDAALFPAPLAHKTPAVLQNCLAILDELQGCISVLDRSGVSKADKKSRWTASRQHIAKLGWTLEGYKSTLGLAVDLVALANARKTASRDQSPSRSSTSEGADQPSDPDNHSEIAKVATRINRVTARLQDEAQQNGAVARLQHYLDAMHAYAVTTMDLELDQLQSHHQAASSVGDAPDSAIEMSCDGQASFPAAAKPPTVSKTHCVGISTDEIDELLDELKEMPGHPPTPPPRSMARKGSRTRTSSDHRPSTSDSYSGGSFSTNGGAANHQRDFSTSGHSRKWSFSPSEVQHGASEGSFTPITDPNSSKSDGCSIRSERVRPDSTTMGQLFGESLPPLWESPRTNVPLPIRPSTSSSSLQVKDNRGSSMIRRSSSRLSTTLRAFNIRLPGMPPQDRPTTAKPPTPPEAEPEPATIFGSPLAKSMQLAKGIAGARHDGGGSSTRDYPLSVLRCVYFIRDHGLTEPDVFGQDGDKPRLAHLKEIFSSPVTSYGKILDWSQFTVHEAADLVLLFLSELPQPLVAEPVAKRWVTLSRQATVSGSMAMRLDQGMDFWEEALSGVRGAARDLFKLLLNLWGEIADAAEENDMTAERLAGRVMRPLLHLSAARYDTDLMLGLAFLIRKRSEYNVKMGGGGRRSNAAF